jgi:PLP dependent protein
METAEGSTLRERLEAVNARIAAACGRAGRDPSEVRLVAVAKSFGPDEVIEAAEAGVTVIGENRVQEARQKIPLCPGNLEWHMIGHLQSNKAREAVRLFRMIHSIDSWSLLETVNRACEEAGETLPVCIEVNVSGEGSKFGVAPDAMPEVLERCRGLINLDVAGLMTIPPAAEDPEFARPFFRRLRERRDAWRRETGFELAELSMGMSHDLEVAVEEGATWVRVGRALFGARKARRVEGEATTG